ncbi:uncharacterized protein BCR38DRAFT_414937 [Pseudomassariella vexata]|uniref:Uncharacterized protein n=1 Tax=Pseudomassariella vexata TaxID=1141098 RepID=A0A1Y2D8A7_9PEZI|nr:uncharacterized protein BCR38DRAFT_414937 [Pseudomassariella vexata]ORY55489.1 hypothetical protein BCR38DRAFT_414937 [Pseudomassariella vexata]
MIPGREELKEPANRPYTTQKYRTGSDVDKPQMQKTPVVAPTVKSRLHVEGLTGVCGEIDGYAAISFQVQEYPDIFKMSTRQKEPHSLKNIGHLIRHKSRQSQ